VEKELCVARWLAAANVPAVRVYEEIDQPLLVDGRPVSFWHEVPGGDPAPTYADLARLLAAFHGLGDCPCELSGFDPLRTSRSRLAARPRALDRDLPRHARDADTCPARPGKGGPDGSDSDNGDIPVSGHQAHVTRVAGQDRDLLPGRR
jgi:hypothetical protein